MKYFLLQFAQKLTAGPGDDQANIPDLSADEVLSNGLNIMYFVAGMIAVIVLIVGGIMYATSSGQAASITKAKNLILYAIVGLVVILAAFAITNLVTGSFS